MAKEFICKSGLNGNNLEWSEFDFLQSFIPQLEEDILNGEAELDEDGNVTDEYYESVTNSNPTYIYYKGDINVQEVFKSDEPLHEVLDWYIIHDTNGNFVSTVGDVPDKYFTDDYLEEIKEKEGR